MNIEYLIKKDEIEISFNYVGGVTEIYIEKVNNNILNVLSIMLINL